MMARHKLVAHTCLGLCSHEHCQYVPTDLGRAVVEYLNTNTSCVAVDHRDETHDPLPYMDQRRR